MKNPLEGLALGSHLLWFRYTNAGHPGHALCTHGYVNRLAENPVNYGVVESGAARLIRMRTSVDLLMEKAGGELGAVMAKKSARCTSSR